MAIFREDIRRLAKMDYCSWCGLHLEAGYEVHVWREQVYCSVKHLDAAKREERENSQPQH